MKRRLPPYPRTFWILIGGLFINRISLSLIWPFLTSYMHETLGIPLTITALLITLQSVSGLISTITISPIMDRVGRKGLMIVGLISTSATLMLMSSTQALPAWVVLIAIYGGVGQLFNVGSNAMVADLVEPGQRTQAYALVRTSSNLGFTIGPAIGGLLIAAFSFNMTFYITAAVIATLALVAIYTLPETIPQRQPHQTQPVDSGFWVILKDRLFVLTWGLYVLSLSAPTMVFNLLLIYAKTNFGIVESQYSLLITTNAGMVVLFQYLVTRQTQRFRPFPVMAAAALFYTLGVGSVALGTSFGGFWVSMVIITTGELLIAPTITGLVANIAPSDQRARYLGVLSMSYPLAAGTAPVIGGFLGDTISPRATWVGGMVMSAFAVIGFYRLARQRMFPPQYMQTSSSPGEATPEEPDMTLEYEPPAPLISTD
ncbi:MAG: MFS transporter [Anaerolineaceae bacterium]|nr:MFS transporter [Anaerolineaceae bacterium]